MTTQRQNTIFGLILLIIACAWTWLVIDTIPPGFGDGDIGPRAFPLIFGVSLGVLSILLLVQAYLRGRTGAAGGQAGAGQEVASTIHWVAAGALLVEISLYGVLLEKCGFVIATLLIIVVVMRFNLNVRSIKKIALMSVGTTLICWAVFEKILGIYLANGTWINLG